MTKTHSTIISILGFGNVGRTISLLLHQRHFTTDIIINAMDVSEKLSGSLLDLAQAGALYGKKISYRFNDMLLYTQSDFIFHCAGVAVVAGGSRRDIAEENRKITQSLFAGVCFTNKPIVIVVTNPVDIISSFVYQYSLLPHAQIIGVGTFLDSIRMKYFLKEEIGEDYKFTSILLGEHGEEIVYMSTYDNFEALGLTSENKKVIVASCLAKTIDSAHQIKKTQGATYYGVACCAVEILNAILQPSDKIFPLSVFVPEKYLKSWDFKPFFMSLPVSLGKGGVAQYATIKATKEEWSKLQAAAKVLTSI